MREAASAVLLLVGAVFLLIAAIGVVRMPDLFNRMQAASKASTLGATCMLLGAALHFGDLGLVARCLAVGAFVFLTTPVGAHMIGRAAYLAGVPLWTGSVADELRGGHLEPGRRPAPEPGAGG